MADWCRFWTWLAAFRLVLLLFRCCNRDLGRDRLGQSKNLEDLWIPVYHPSSKTEPEPVTAYGLTSWLKQHCFVLGFPSEKSRSSRPTKAKSLTRPWPISRSHSRRPSLKSSTLPQSHPPPVPPRRGIPLYQAARRGPAHDHEVCLGVAHPALAHLAVPFPPPKPKVVYPPPKSSSTRASPTKYSTSPSWPPRSSSRSWSTSGSRPILSPPRSAATPTKSNSSSTPTPLTCARRCAGPSSSARFASPSAALGALCQSIR